jgi:hypothetical protein
MEKDKNVKEIVIIAYEKRIRITKRIRKDETGIIKHVAQISSIEMEIIAIISKNQKAKIILPNP